MTNQTLFSLQQAFQNELLKKPLDTPRANETLLELIASYLSSGNSLDTLELSWRQKPFPLLIYLLLNLEHHLEDLVDAESTMVLMNTFLSQGGSAHSLSSHGHSALQYAVSQNGESVTRFLVEQGADPYYLDPQGDTLLHIAIENQISLELKTYLCETLDLSNLSHRRRHDGQTALHLAISMGDVECAELMIRNGFPLDQPDYLHRACQSFGGASLVRALYLKGTPLNIRHQGISALEAAAIYQKQQTLQFLIEQGYPTVFDPSDLLEALEASRNSPLDPREAKATQDYLNHCIMVIREQQELSSITEHTQESPVSPENPPPITRSSAPAGTPPAARRHL